MLFVTTLLFYIMSRRYQVELLNIPFSSIFSTGNLGAVAQCLDALETVSASDLDTVINALNQIYSPETLGQALNQLQPSLFTSLAIAQENDTLYIRDTITHRMENVRHKCPQKKNDGFWATPLAARTVQNTHNFEPGFAANSVGFFMGADGTLSSHYSIGGGIGYLHDDLHWKDGRGQSYTNSAYSAFYAKWETTHGYLQGGLIGGYNLYKTHRDIQFGTSLPIDRQAKGSHHGAEGAGYLQLGAKATQNWISFSPFLSLDYLFLHENDFKEHGANSLNLFVESKNSALLSSQLGIDFWYRRVFSCCQTFTPYAELSVIRESRFLGRREDAKFEGICPMNIVGYYPSRTLGGAAAGLDWTFQGGEVSLSYQGKFGDKYSDNAVFLELMLSW